jgi:hypothetical protein
MVKPKFTENYFVTRIVTFGSIVVVLPLYTGTEL